MDRIRVARRLVCLAKELAAEEELGKTLSGTLGWETRSPNENRGEWLVRATSEVKKGDVGALELTGTKVLDISVPGRKHNYDPERRWPGGIRGWAKVIEIVDDDLYLHTRRKHGMGWQSVRVRVLGPYHKGEWAAKV